MAELRFTAKFAEDLEDITRYIERDSAILAREFVRRLFSQLEVLKSNPQIGRMVPEQQNSAVREIFFGNYRIVYRLRSEIVELLMVRHAARLR